MTDKTNMVVWRMMRHTGRDSDWHYREPEAMTTQSDRSVKMAVLGHGEV